MNFKFRFVYNVKVFILFTLTVFPSNQQTPEVLRIPSTCNSIQCNKGYYCLVKVHNCSWGENCMQRIARCVPEEEYYTTTASCVDFQCPEGHKCILRESLCDRPPCKVLKSCARNTVAENWFKKCKQLGCTSEYECFIRRPTDKCDSNSCKHTPDCMLPSENELNKRCRGWVCPLKHECLAHEIEPCQENNCQIFRTCRSTEPPKIKLKTLPELEKDWFFQEEAKWKLQTLLTTTKSIIDKVPGYDRMNQLFFKPVNTISSIQGDNLEALNRARIMPNSQNVPIYKNPTRSPLWLKSLISKTGVEIINFWVKEAERNQHHEEFHQWLESIRIMLSPEKYRIWLENIRSQTSHSKKFQHWLPIPVPIKNYNNNFGYFSDFDTKMNDMEGEVLSTFPKSQLDKTFKFLEYKEQKNILTTVKPDKKLSSVGTSIATVSKSVNDSLNKSELEKNSLIPAFIIIQTSPRESPNLSSSQQLNQQILDPSLTQVNSNQQFQVSQPVFSNFMTAIPTYHYRPENNFQQLKSFLPYFQWMNLVNSVPSATVSPQLNNNLIPPNYLQNYILPTQGQRSIIYWYHPDFGYGNMQPQYDFNQDESRFGDYDQMEDYFEEPESNFHSRRKINWSGFSANREKTNFHNLRDEHRRSKIDRFRHQKSKRKDFSKIKNSETEDNREIQEEEIQFLKKILQGILDYNLDDTDEKMENEKKEKGSQAKHQRRKKNENDNEKVKRKEKDSDEKKVKDETIIEEIDNNPDDVLMETLFNLIKEQFKDNQENITDKSDQSSDEMGNEAKNETKVLEEELQKLFGNFDEPLEKDEKEADSAS